MPKYLLAALAKFDAPRSQLNGLLPSSLCAEQCACQIDLH